MVRDSVDTYNGQLTVWLHTWATYTSMISKASVISRISQEIESRLNSKHLGNSQGEWSAEMNGEERI